MINSGFCCVQSFCFDICQSSLNGFRDASVRHRSSAHAHLHREQCHIHSSVASTLVGCLFRLTIFRHSWRLCIAANAIAVDHSNHSSKQRLFCFQNLLHRFFLFTLSFSLSRTRHKIVIVVVASIMQLMETDYGIEIVDVKSNENEIIKTACT